MAARPDRQMAYASVGITTALLLLVFWFSPDKGPSMYYSGRWQIHNPYYAGCADCHRPFARVANTDCLPCHKEYETGFDPDTLLVYTEEAARDSERKARVLHAHLLYHALPAIASMDCSACHPEHIPPSYPHGWNFVHAFGNHLPIGTLRLQECIHCHTGHQAPPDLTHAVYREALTADTDCSTCHGSTISWRLDASGIIEGDARILEYRSLFPERAGE